MGPRSRNQVCKRKQPTEVKEGDMEEKRIRSRSEEETKVVDVVGGEVNKK